MNQSLGETPAIEPSFTHNGIMFPPMRKDVVCKRCKQDGLRWGLELNAWRLYCSLTLELHQCGVGK